MRDDDRGLKTDAATSGVPIDGGAFRAPDTGKSWLKSETDPSEHASFPPMPRSTIPMANGDALSLGSSSPPVVAMGMPSHHPEVQTGKEPDGLPDPTPGPPPFEPPCPDQPDLESGPTTTPGPLSPDRK